MTTPDGAGFYSPWRSIFEELRDHFDGVEEPTGIVATIPWLRDEMARAGGNPRIIRNIIYRDKGRIPDKQVLYQVFKSLWERAGKGEFIAPELDYLIEPGSEIDQEVMRLLSREKRRAFKFFVGASRLGESPKMLLIGPTGAGKTMITDYIQLALERLGSRTPEIARFEFGTSELTVSLSRLAAALGVGRTDFNTLLAEVGASSSYAVQADAQAAIAQLIIDAAHRLEHKFVLMVYISRRIDSKSLLGDTPLRLNTPDVPQATAVEWLWYSVFEPLSAVENLSIIVSLTTPPNLVIERLGGFREPIQLKPPSRQEARRYMRGRLPDFDEEEREQLVLRAGRSYEELRSIALFTEADFPIPRTNIDDPLVTSLAKLVHADSDLAVRRFLRAVAVLSLPDWPTFRLLNLMQLQGVSAAEPDRLGMEFLDAVPGEAGWYRPFSRRFQNALRHEFKTGSNQRYRELHRFAATLYRDVAQNDPQGEAACRMVLHSIHGDKWDSLARWFDQYPIPHPVSADVWQLATTASAANTISQHNFEEISRRIVRHYLTLGAYTHPDLEAALTMLDRSAERDIRTWSTIRRAEIALAQDRFASVSELFEQLPHNLPKMLAIDAGIIETALLHWRNDANGSHRVLEQRVLAPLRRKPNISDEDHLRVRATAWSAAIATQQGDLIEVLNKLVPLHSDDRIVASRVAYRIADAARQLGLFTLAENRYEYGKQLAESARALPHEISNFSLGLANVFRHRADFAKTDQHLRTARRVICEGITDATQCAYRSTLVQEETGIFDLASGQAVRAIGVFNEVLDALRNYQQSHSVDLTLRILQTRMHISVAYTCLGTGVPLLKPYPVIVNVPLTNDLAHGLDELARISHQLRSMPDDGRTRSLRARTLFTQVLFHPDPTKKRAALREVAGLVLQPRQRIETHLLAALVDLAANDETAALKHIQNAEGATAALREEGQRFAQLFGIETEESHPGLRAQSIALRIILHVQRNQPLAAAAVLSKALNTAYLVHYHEGLLRTFGNAIEANGSPNAWKQHRELRQLLRVDGTGPTTPTRLPDALVAGWRAHQSSPDI